MYTYICTCIHICIYICTHAYLYVYIYLYIRRVCIHLRLCRWKNARAHTPVDVLGGRAPKDGCFETRPFCFFLPCFMCPGLPANFSTCFAWQALPNQSQPTRTNKGTYTWSAQAFWLLWSSSLPPSFPHGARLLLSLQHGLVNWGRLC